GLTEVPAIVKEFNDNEMMEVALLENLQREDLTVIEEATAYKNLIEELKLTQEELYSKLGKSRSHISNTMRILSIPQEIIVDISNVKLYIRHGKAIQGLKKMDKMIPLGERKHKEHLNVRQVEKIITEINPEKPKQKKRKEKKYIFITETEDKLRDILGTNVTIRKNKRKSKIEIDFHSNDELNRFIDLLEK